MISQVRFDIGFRTFLAAPLRQQGELIGSLNARRIEVRPFTPTQIKLLETFADQAVIAIENVRLFNELKESLEQQTATSEILGVIASSPTDIQPVLETVVKNAARVCGADRRKRRLSQQMLSIDRGDQYGPCRRCGVGTESASSIEIRIVGELLSTAKPFTFGTSREVAARISQKPSPEPWCIEQCSGRSFAARRGSRSERS